MDFRLDYFLWVCDHNFTSYKIWPMWVFLLKEYRLLDRVYMDRIVLFQIKEKRIIKGVQVIC